ncbi:FecR domain-containing protein [Aliifodinibius sp. S!AR15-10]|uniref:FecR family protein n=1 Tax=Aliifodinibius sp. S!AR15-10 TaxID=2950437 RepID=UPI00285949E7|nr:FecR domain-containing protein [Aliifodinibius sp. S!AR15-10]MDR8390188.1 FecR domain-containing protein [Aliifodinibius sp. S!AR15-10]
MEQRNYTVEELIHNPSFRRMANGTAKPDEIEVWSQWMEASDQNREKAKKALSEIAGFGFRQADVPDSDEEWEKLFHKTMGKSKGDTLRTDRKDSTIRWVYRIAAMILLAGTVVWSLYLQSGNSSTGTQLEQITQKETVKTGPDQQKALTFTSNSRVAKIVLNSNSSITYSMGLIHDQPIQVTLKGEAFFDVEKGFSSEQPAFSVTTPDGVIEDLGTEFLVTVQPEESRVVLQEGIVRVQSVEGDKSKEFQVKKNEMVAFRKTGIVRQETVNSTFYTSWATGSMEFDQTKISTFAEYVENRFSVNVEISNQEVAEITLEGAVYFKSLEGLVRSVSDITNIPVYQSGDGETVYIGNMHNTN